MIIYKATNKINGKIYIGKTTTSLKKRMSEHKRHSKNSKMVFHLAIDKYGFDNFMFETLFECGDFNTLNRKEIELIFEYNATDITIGYNRSLGGDGADSGENHPFFGKKRADISIMFSGKGHPNYGNVGELSPRYGQKHTDKTKDKISKSLKGVFSGKNNPSFDDTKYEFEHQEYGKKICTKYELRKEFNLDSKCVAHICIGKRKTHKGWKMIRCVSGMDSQQKQKRDEALPLGESMTPEAQPIAFAVGG